jgi:UDP-N-acetylmuramyl pentapeptide phosphotransferase/UDP-N-acetylglucosamine-1-phosphate transferase
MPLDIIWWVTGLAFTVPLLVSLIGTPATRAVLQRRQIYDQPNERSSHSIPTPRGAGIPVMVGVLLVLLLYPLLVTAQGRLGLLAYMPFFGALLLAAVSWVDDVRGLGALSRLVVQAAVVVASVLLVPLGPAASNIGVPEPVLQVIVVLAWIWFINLYNFMDGIDGICGVETLCIALGFVVVNGLIAVHGGFAILTALLLALQAPLALALIGGTLGFLPWNWHPARIFLGDVGSVPLGYLIGWLLVMLVVFEYMAAALILPMYYVADATITLLRRLRRGQRPWQAHREHYYQRATDAGLSHSRVSLGILVGNLALIGCAAGSVWRPIIALAAAVVVTTLMIVWMATRKPSSP